MREWPYTALSRPRDFPRPSRFPSGFVLGKSLGLREISWSSGMYNPLCLSSPQCTDTIQCLTYEMRATLLGCTLQIYVLAGPDVSQNLILQETFLIIFGVANIAMHSVTEAPGRFFCFISVQLLH